MISVPGYSANATFVMRAFGPPAWGLSFQKRWRDHAAPPQREEHAPDIESPAYRLPRTCAVLQRSHNTACNLVATVQKAPSPVSGIRSEKTPCRSWQSRFAPRISSPRSVRRQQVFLEKHDHSDAD